MSNYPTIIDDASSLLVPADSSSTKSLSTTLAVSCLGTDTTIQLINTPSSIGAPTAFGIACIDDEQIVYAGISGATLTGCVRSPSTRVGHSSGASVKFKFVSRFMAELQAAVEAIETVIGVTGSFNFLQSSMLTTSVGSPGVDTKIPTEKAVRTALGSGSSGDVVGPGSAVADHLPQFSGTTGKLIKDGLGLVTTVANPGSDSNVPSEKAVRTELLTKVAGTLVTSIGSPGSDSNVPTEKAVRTNITVESSGSFYADGSVAAQVYGSPYSIGISANRLSTDGNSIRAQIVGVAHYTGFTSGSASPKVRIVFGGTTILEMIMDGGLPTTSLPFILDFYVVRSSSTTARAIATFNPMSNASVLASSIISTFTNWWGASDLLTSPSPLVHYTELTGLNFAALINLTIDVANGTYHAPILKSGWVQKSS